MKVTASQMKIKNRVFLIKLLFSTLPLRSKSRKAIAINNPMLNTPVSCIKPLANGERISIKYAPKLLYKFFAGAAVFLNFTRLRRSIKGLLRIAR